MATAMTPMNFDYLLQTYALAYLRTGDPVTDMMIVSLVLYLSTSVLGKLRTVNWSSWIPILRNEQTFFIEEHVESQHQVFDSNDVFLMMQWYISTIENSKEGCFEVSKILARQTFISPAEGYVHKFNYSGFTINYSIEKLTKTIGKDKERSYRRIRLGVKANDADILQRFVAHVEEEYAKDVLVRKWKQSVWILKRDHSPYWRQRETDNNKTLDTLVLPRHQTKKLEDDVKNFLNGQSWYDRTGTPWRRGYMLVGNPGTGKTSIIGAVANTYKHDIYCLNLNLLHDDAELEEMISRIPSKSVITMEDIDCMTNVVHRRETPDVSIIDADEEGDDKSLLKRKPKGITLSGLLNVLDGFCVRHGIIVFMTTNHLEKLDPALIRPGRIDMILHLDYCTVEQIQDMYRLFFNADIPEAILDKLVDRIVSPAELSCIFQHHRPNPQKALEEVVKVTARERPDTEVAA